MSVFIAEPWPFVISIISANQLRIFSAGLDCGRGGDSQSSFPAETFQPLPERVPVVWLTLCCSPLAVRHHVPGSESEQQPDHKKRPVAVSSSVAVPRTPLG